MPSDDSPLTGTNTPELYLGHFRSLLRTGNPRPSTDLSAAPLGGTEGIDEDGEPDLSDAGISDRLDVTHEQLRHVVEKHLGGRQDLLDIVDRIIKGGERGLKILAEDDANAVRRDDEVLAEIETIVRIDGSRPSFMVRNGDADLTTCPPGGWATHVETSGPELRKALACVGRVDSPSESQGFAGTGFLIQRNLIMTNRHVLQVVAERMQEGWRFKPNTAIDFGHEFRVDKAYPRCALKRVVYAGPSAIDLDGPVDHTKLDLALIEIEQPDGGELPEQVLSIDISKEWAAPDGLIYVVGYPGRPRLGAFSPTLLEQLFQSTFGCKRVAPGVTARPFTATPKWTTGHDTTTLGGNSGSNMLVIGRETAVAGLHYGGRTKEPRENWGHIIGEVLDMPGDDPTQGTLRECLRTFQVDCIDRVVGP